jgi:isopentenyl diphosphate isomerase/L-lactate dehydrogenase-like FMN-dependent dehydrogenase
MPVFEYRLSSNVGPITIEDYRQLARRRLPDMVWSYIDYGAEDLRTMLSNRDAFARYALRRRVLTGREATDIGTTIGGRPIALPVLLAPTGLAGLSHWTGERGAARAAEAAGTLSILSTASSYSLEEVAAGTRKGHFFQLYPWADLATGRHDLALSLIKRARDAGYQAMFVTVDVPGTRKPRVRAQARHGIPANHYPRPCSQLGAASPLVDEVLAAPAILRAQPGQ